MFKIIRQILKLEPGISIGQWCWDRVTGNWVWLLSLSGGGGMGYLAAITSWIAPWGPIGWGAVGLVSFLICMVALASVAAVRGYAKSQNALARFAEESPKTTTVNVLQDNFSTKIIKLADFYHPYFLPKKYIKFRDCEINGPASSLLSGGGMESSRLVDCDVVIINDVIQAFTIMKFENCTFERCVFFRMTFFVTSSQAITMKNKIGNINVIAGLTHPLISSPTETCQTARN
jgi:hypothetical protein